MTTADTAVCYADLAARVALSETGRSLRSRLPRALRGHHGPFQKLPQCQWHTVVPGDNLTQMNLDSIIAGSFSLVDATKPDEQPCVRGAVETYVHIIVRSQTPHDRDNLERYLHNSGCLTDKPLGEGLVSGL